MNGPHNQLNGRLTVTVKQLAEMMGLNESAIYQLTSQKRIPHVKIGRRVLFPVEVVRKWLEEHAVSAKDSR